MTKIKSQSNIFPLHIIVNSTIQIDPFEGISYMNESWIEY